MLRFSIMYHLEVFKVLLYQANFFCDFSLFGNVLKQVMYQMNYDITYILAFCSKNGVGGKRQ